MQPRHHTTAMLQLKLSVALALAELYDKDYDQRIVHVTRALATATEIGYPTGIRLDAATGPDWPVIYIELPSGQVSWHVPAHAMPWDGHDTAEKYRRCRAYSLGLYAVDA